ncbi:MAG: hypothetical protein L3K13_05180 [Thermoplasmata archaeon]|nr:hypothetical protein [Thermoplasmata archaeon]
MTEADIPAAQAPPEATPPAPAAADESREPFPWFRLLLMFSVIAGAVALLEVVYAQAPVPPGVDPGDWITRGGAYVGLGAPPVDSFGSAYIYPPLVFPMLGGLLLLFGSPVSTGFVAGGLILVLFGLSVAYLAFRFVRFGPLQVGFVGACVFSGTLLYMLFWGAYPNFFAFVFLNLLFVVLFAFYRFGLPRDGFFLGAVLALLYLAHSLTFALGLATVAATALLLLLLDGPKFLLRRLMNRGLWVGAALLAAVVGAYSLSLRVTNVTPPNYLGANPAALTIDNIGQLFVPLSTGPAFLPPGSAVYLSPTAMIALLLGCGGLLVLALVLARRFRPGWTDARFTVAGGAVLAALLVPVGGALAHVGTDYPRFLYFLPVPVTLLIVLTLDKLVERWSDAPPLSSGSEVGTPVRWTVETPKAGVAVGYFAVAAVLVLLVSNVSIPASLNGERVDSGTTHSADFLGAAQWLAQSPTPGSVLTLQGTARWVQALTHRGTFDIGPTWLDFEPWQIVNSQAAYWALNSRYAATDGSATLSYTPTNTTVLNQAPMYSVYVDGVIFPIARILPGALAVSVVDVNGTRTISGSTWGPGALSFDPITGAGSIVYTTPWFVTTVAGTVGPGGGAWINMSVAAAPGESLSAVSVSLASPPAGVALLHAPSSENVSVTPSGFLWSSTGSLGQLPNPATILTTGSFSPSPSSSSVSLFPVNETLTSTFAAASGSHSLNVSLLLTTPGTGDPGVNLPRVLDTNTFLVEHDIHFLLLSAGAPYAPNIEFFQTIFGYTTVYQNPTWQVLED